MFVREVLFSYDDVEDTENDLLVVDGDACLVGQVGVRSPEMTFNLKFKSNFETELTHSGHIHIFS